jgi:hypothetical protein
LQSCDQKTVIAARLVTGDCAKRIAADAVGHQPFARFRGAQVAANFTAEIDSRWSIRRGKMDWEIHIRMMEPSRYFGPEKNWLSARGKLSTPNHARVNERNELSTRPDIRVAP